MKTEKHEVVSEQDAKNYIPESKVRLLEEKWGKMLNAEGTDMSPITDPTTRRNTAIILENQEKYLIESNVAGGAGNVFGYGGAGASFGTYGGSVGNQDFYATGDSRLPKILIPMIRRTFPELMTNEIVGVQPMAGPVGLAFAIRYYADGSSLDWQDPSRRTYDANNPNRFRGGVQAAANGTEIGYNQLWTGYTGTSSAKLSGGDTESGFTFLDEDKGVAEMLANYEMTGQIPQVTPQFVKTSVEAGTRRIAAKYSMELEQDLKNMNGIDIDNEITNVMSYEIQAEIDREMVIRMLQICLNAGKGYGWSIWNPASADGRWQAERNVVFYQKVLIEANRIAVKSRRGAANFIIATPTICSIFEALPEFKFYSADSSVKTQATGVSKVGTLAGRFTVYRDTRTESQQPWITARRSTRLEYALLGYKGSEYYDCAIVYCPYIPVMIQRTLGPNDMSPRIGIMTRYGVVDHLFGGELYLHLIIVQGLGDGFDPLGNKTYL